MNDDGMVAIINDLSRRIDDGNKVLGGKIDTVDGKVDEVAKDVAVIKQNMESTCKRVDTIEVDLKHHKDHHVGDKRAKMSRRTQIIIALIGAIATVAAAYLTIWRR